MKRCVAVLLGFSITCAGFAAEPRAAEAARRTRQWRVAHETQILDEVSRFLALPNVATTLSDVDRNADAIVEMFRQRGIVARQLRIEGVPALVVADVKSPRAKQTIAFYAHYDGQPVDASQWTTPPWQPTILPAGPVTPESRIYARSASDDKSPIVAMLAALDALRAAKIAPSVNLRFVFEGEEEQGSPHLSQYFDRFPNELSADAWILADGPVHPTRKQQIFFGARGVVDLEITTYGPSRALHSGNYGNWAVNPIVTLSRLIAGLRDDNARILVAGFYDDVRALTPLERDAIAAAPNADETMRRELALGRVEGTPLLEQLQLPALNLRGISSGAVGDKAANAIPTEATASIDFRLVPDQTPESVRRRVEAHLTSLGFFITRTAPTTEERLAHEKIVRLAWGSGYPPARTPLDLPISRRVRDVVSAAIGYDTVVVPSLGGSVPMYVFRRGDTPVIGVPMVNHDNRQHAPDENLRIQNLWDGIEVYAALFAGL